MDCTKERSIERSKYYESDKDSWFFKGSCRFKIFCKRESFNPLTHIIYYHKSCYMNYTNNHTEKPSHDDKEQENKNLIYAHR